jgi:hypothetical protein
LVIFFHIRRDQMNPLIVPAPSSLTRSVFTCTRWATISASSCGRWRCRRRRSRGR